MGIRRRGAIIDTSNKQPQSLGLQIKKEKIKRLKLKLRRIDGACAIIGIVGTLLGLIEHEIFFCGSDGCDEDKYRQRQLLFQAANATGSTPTFSESTQYEITDWSIFLRTIVSISTIALVVLNSTFYYRSYIYRRLKGLSTNVGETFTTSSEFRYLLLTSFINILHPFPAFEFQFIDYKDGFELRYSISTLLANLMLLRVYLVLRLIPHVSKWTDIHSEDCCEREGI